MALQYKKWEDDQIKKTIQRMEQRKKCEQKIKKIFLQLSENKKFQNALKELEHQIDRALADTYRQITIKGCDGLISHYSADVLHQIIETYRVDGVLLNDQEIECLYAYCKKYLTTLYSDAGWEKIDFEFVFGDLGLGNEYIVCKIKI